MVDLASFKNITLKCVKHKTVSSLPCGIFVQNILICCTRNIGECNCVGFWEIRNNWTPCLMANKLDMGLYVDKMYKGHSQKSSDPLYSRERCRMWQSCSVLLSRPTKPGIRKGRKWHNRKYAKWVKIKLCTWILGWNPADGTSWRIIHPNGRYKCGQNYVASLLFIPKNSIKLGETHLFHIFWYTNERKASFFTCTQNMFRVRYTYQLVFQNEKPSFSLYCLTILKCQTWNNMNVNPNWVRMW